jgi:hypothetical protein
MNAFYEHHKDNIQFHYRCFDRILTERIDPAVPATRAGPGILQHVSSRNEGSLGKL